MPKSVQKKRRLKYYEGVYEGVFAAVVAVVTAFCSMRWPTPCYATFSNLTKLQRMLISNKLLRWTTNLRALA